jgi:senataxin
MPLWLALSRQYNESQLRAICMVSRRNQEKLLQASAAAKSAGAPVDSSSLSLLQGPPGTGKTRTILGIVSVFLAGALNLTAQGTTRIVAGASLYGEMAGENSTKWSDEKLSRPRGGSISVTTAAAGDAAAKRTRVLICAPSNTAVDEVVYRLVTQVRATPSPSKASPSHHLP